MKQLRISKQGALKGLLVIALAGNISWPIFMRSSTMQSDEASVAPGSISHDLEEIKDGSGGGAAAPVTEAVGPITTAPEDRKVVVSESNAIRLSSQRGATNHCGLDLNLVYREVIESSGERQGQISTTVEIWVDKVVGNSIKSEKVGVGVHAPGNIRSNLDNQAKKDKIDQIVLRQTAEYQGNLGHTCREYAQQHREDDHSSRSSNERRYSRDDRNSDTFVDCPREDDDDVRVQCLLKRVDQSYKLKDEGRIAAAVNQILEGDFKQLVRNGLLASGTRTREGKLTREAAREALHSAIESVKSLQDNGDMSSEKAEAAIRKLSDMEKGGALYQISKSELEKRQNLLKTIQATRASFPGGQIPPQYAAQFQAQFLELQNEFRTIAMPLASSVQTEKMLNYVQQSDFNLYAAPFAPIQTLGTQTYQAFSVSQLGTALPIQNVPGYAPGTVPGVVNGVPLPQGNLPMINRPGQVGVPGVYGAGAVVPPGYNPALGNPQFAQQQMMAQQQAIAAAQQGRAFGVAAPIYQPGFTPGVVMPQNSYLLPTQAPFSPTTDTYLLDRAYSAGT